MSDAIKPYQYPKEIEELAFLGYIQSNRNISRTHRWLLEHCTEEEFLPDRSTISRWARYKRWDTKADEAISEAFPHIRRRQLANLVALTDRAQEFDAALLAGEFDHVRSVGLVMAKVQTSTITKSLSGLGTAGSRAEEVRLAPVQAVEAVSEKLTPQERAQIQRNRLMADQ